MADNNADKFLSHNLFRSLMCVAVLVLAACYVFGEDAGDSWALRDPTTGQGAARSDQDGDLDQDLDQDIEPEPEPDYDRLREPSDRDGYTRQQRLVQQRYAQQRYAQQKYAQQRYAQQQYLKQQVLRQALIRGMQQRTWQRQQQQQRQRQQQRAPSGSFIHRGYGGGTGGDGKTFYAIGKGWSYTGG